MGCTLFPLARPMFSTQQHPSPSRFPACVLAESADLPHSPSIPVYHHRAEPDGLRRPLRCRRRQVAVPGAPQVPQEAVGDHGALRLARVPQRAPGRARVPRQVPGHHPGRPRQGHRAHLRPGDRLRHQVLHPRLPPEPPARAAHPAAEARPRALHGRQAVRPHQGLPRAIRQHHRRGGRQHHWRRLPEVSQACCCDGTPSASAPFSSPV